MTDKMARYDLIYGMIIGGSLGFMIGYLYFQNEDDKVTTISRNSQGRVTDIMTKKV